MDGWMDGWMDGTKHCPHWHHESYEFVHILVCGIGAGNTRLIRLLQIQIHSFHAIHQTSH
jgi:hypothetical protein